MVKIRYASRQVIMAAIEATSAKFDNNIEANRFDAVGGHFEVTIKAKSSRGAGAKVGISGRRTQSACWHAWGIFINEIFRLSHDAVIISMGRRITAHSGNWEDHNIGNGIMESEMCSCDAGQCDEANATWITQQNAVSAGIQASQNLCAESNRRMDEQIARERIIAERNDPTTVCRDCEATEQLSCLCVGTNGVPLNCVRYHNRHPDEVDTSQYIPTPTIMPETKAHQCDYMNEVEL